MATLGGIRPVCQNPKCEYYLQEKGKAIIKRGKYRNGNQRYYCKHCATFFAETKGTVFYRKRLNEDDIKLICRLFLEKNGIRSIERITGHHRDTISGLLKEALENKKTANDFLLKNAGFTPDESDQFWKHLGKMNLSSITPPEEAWSKTAVLYISTDEKNQHEYELYQIEKLEKYCMKKKYRIYRRYIDRGISIRDCERSSLNQLILDAGKKKIDIVLVTKMTRFGDTLTDCVLNIKTLESYNISFAAILQGIDTSTSKKKLIFRIIDACFEFEKQ